MPIRLLVVDDHDLLREGIKARLTGEDDIEIVGEGKNGKDAVALCAQLQPDLVLMDVSMPVMNGLDAAREIKARFDKIKVIFLSVYDDKEYVDAAMQLGAGFVLKDVAKEAMLRALRSAATGNQVMCAKASEVIEKHEKETAARVNRYGLSSREEQVLGKVAQGLSNKQIAYELDISVRTVESHRSAIREKTGGGNAAALSKIAAEMGL